MSLEQTTQKGTGDAVQERIVLIATSELYTFPDHPYGVRDDPAMLNTVSSIQQSGVLVPAIVRPRESGGYELISGHRRKAACERLGIPAHPACKRKCPARGRASERAGKSLQDAAGGHKTPGRTDRFNFAE